MRQQGFTLVEVLIALAITAFVAAASYAGISTVITGAEQLRAAAERTRDINRAFMLLDRDVRQFINRPIRDEFGSNQPALVGGPLAFFPLSLTRGGWHNSLQLPRSEVQRVDYYLEDGALWRAYHPVLDRAVDVEPLTVMLLPGVDNLELRFLDAVENLQLDRNLVADTRNWARNWIGEPGVGAPVPPPPAAIELRIELADLGEIRRLYELPVR